MGTQSPKITHGVEEEKRSGPRVAPGTISRLGMGVFLVFIILAVYVFALIQLVRPGDAWLAAMIPFRGHFGVDQALPGVSYTELSEYSGSLSFLGLFIYSLGRVESSSIRGRALVSLSLPLKAFGLAIAAIVYTETHLLWGELWYGAKLFTVNPQGFPWGNERVASNLCFLHGSDYVPAYGSNCWFLNYDELLYVAIGMFILGWLISRTSSIRGAAATES
ncbi:MAG TPA: hypothetical protein VIW22_06660 [Nitrososphaerales archaeon]